MSTQLSWKFLKAKAGHYWEVYNGDGELVGRSSQYFTGTSGVQYNARLLGYEEKYSDNIDWQFGENEENNWDWSAFSTVNFEQIASSHESFASREEAEQNAELFGYNPVTTARAVSYRWLWWLLGALALLGLIFFWPQLSKTNNSSTNNKPTFAYQLNQSDISVFNDLLNTSGTNNDLTRDQYTVFAPMNSSFANFTPDQMTELKQLANRGILNTFLNNHIVKFNYPKNALTNNLAFKAVSGKDLTITRDGDSASINGVQILDDGTETQNGTLYKISGSLSGTDFLAQLINAPDATPTNSMSSSSSSETPTSSVSMSSSSVASVSSSSVAEIVPTSLNTYDTLNADAQFSTLVKALNAAGLADSIRNGGYTLLAPTNSAFAKIGDEEVNRLLLPENQAELIRILKFHVLPGNLTSDTLKASTQQTTLLGNYLYVSNNNNILVVSGNTDATIIKRDIKTASGLIQVLDSVLTPTGK